MKKRLLAVLFICSAAFAASPQASDASIQEMLNLAEAPKLLDSVKGQLNGLSQNMIRQALGGKQPTVAQQAALNKYLMNCNLVLQDELTWAKLEPIYLRIYRESFTQEELDGIIAFYKTPAGQALVKKMPLLMQKVMAEMPGMIGPITQKLQGYAQQLAADLKAADSVPAPAPEAAPAALPAPAATK